jgi:hypothetical protein
MMEVTHAPPLAYAVKEKTKEELLEDATLAVKNSTDVNTFVSFLKAFLEAESEHIGRNLSKEHFNLRTAALCAEAYATGQLLLDSIESKTE